MSGARQVWLIARRELRERSRSSAFRISLVIMVLTVVAIIVLPAVLTSSDRSRDIGFTGHTPAELPRTVNSQLAAIGTTGHTRTYDGVAAGERAVRDGDIDVLVVDGNRLEWPKRADQKLKATVTGAIQLVAVQQRAAAAGITPDQLRAVAAPVRVDNVELSKVAGRSAGDETAVIVMIGLLLLTISIYGGLVLGGVVEEKANRVVEVLLARVPPRRLLAGKVLGIGLLGLAQVAVTAAAAFVAVATVDAFDVPAIRGAVLAWAVVWFVLGYAFYATMYGALGSLASRQEDAQTVAAPGMMVLVASYFAVFFLVAHADSAGARALSYFPTTAPMAMPTRIAMAAGAWWEPFLAVAVTLLSTFAIVRLGGRLYASAILHGGPTLSLRDAWHAANAAPRDTAGHLHHPVRTAWKAVVEGRAHMSPDQSVQRSTLVVVSAVGVTLGVIVALVTTDVILGVIAGSLLISLVIAVVRVWTGGGTQHPRHP
jgi:ABC-2 type transport system permease protein